MILTESKFKCDAAISALSLIALFDIVLSLTTKYDAWHTFNIVLIDYLTARIYMMLLLKPTARKTHFNLTIKQSYFMHSNMFPAAFSTLSIMKLVPLDFCWQTADHLLCFWMFILCEMKLDIHLMELKHITIVQSTVTSYMDHSLLSVPLMDGERVHNAGVSRNALKLLQKDNLLHIYITLLA